MTDLRRYPIRFTYFSNRVKQKMQISSINININIVNSMYSKNVMCNIN